MVTLGIFRGEWFRRKGVNFSVFSTVGLHIAKYSITKIYNFLLNKLQKNNPILGIILVFKFDVLINYYPSLASSIFAKCPIMI
jgi:hypothetical protein